jgi:hypothetical protein
MITESLIANPLFPRAIVIGLFGAAGLALTALYSRRGPMIFPVYAAYLAALAVVSARFAALPFAVRFAALLVSFCIASAGLSVTADHVARRGRQRLVAEGRLPTAALSYRVSFGGYVARAGFLVTIGAVVSAGVAFVAA